MGSTRSLQLGLSILLFAGAIALGVWSADGADLIGTAATIPALSLLYVVSLMLAGVLTAALRFQTVAADLGYRLGYRDALSIFCLSQLAGILFFQLPGQLLARSALLARRAVPVSGAIVITGYERLCSLIVSLVLASAAAVYLFGRIHLDLAGGGTTFLKIVVGLAAATIGGALFGWGRAALKLRPLFERFDPLTFARTLALSLLIQLLTMLGYVLLVRSMMTEISPLALAAASALVMLAASLPISLAGWGMREMSAIFALGAVGVSAQASLVSAILMGVISIAALGAVLPLTIGRNDAPAAPTGASGAPVVDYAAILSYVLPLAAATAVFFQLFIPAHQGLLNVNLADPIVVLAGAYFAVRQFRRGLPAWRYPHLNPLILAATAVMVLAYLHGLLRFGWSDWAFSNKLIGWFVLLCYGATGALIVRHAGAAGLQLLGKTFAAAAASIVLMDYVILLGFRLGIEQLQPMLSLPFTGLSQNRNAFGFILLMAAAVLMASRDSRSGVLAGVVLAGIWYTGSRSIFVALPFVVGAALILRWLTWRFALRALAVALGMFAIATVLPVVVAAMATGPTMALSELIRPIMTAPTSDVERMVSITGGWELFLNNPLFGAGLGAFIQQQIAAGQALVIHSVPVWLLAEMGLIGAAIIAAPVFVIFFGEMRRREHDTAGVLIVLMIVGFAVVGMVHDILYQRGFWLLLGAAAASQAAIWGAPGRR